MIQNGTKFEWIIFHEFVKWLRHDTMIEWVLNTFDRCLKYHSLGLCDVQWARATALWFFFVLFPSEPFPIHKFHICTVPKQVLLSISVYPSVFLKKKTRQLCICTSHCTTPYEPEWLICSGFTVGWICKIVSSISSNRESPDGLGEDGRVCLCAPFPNFWGPTWGPLWTVRFRKVWEISIIWGYGIVCQPFRNKIEMNMWVS